LNSNGNVDKGEPPLAWITIDMLNGYKPSITGADGIGIVDKFKPGCICECWKNEEVLVVVPPGFKATTPTQFKLAEENITYNFGFIVDESIERPSFQGEPDWYQAFINRGLVLSAFHYIQLVRQLEITLTTNTGGFNWEQSYQHTFDVIDNLNSYSKIGFSDYKLH